MNGAHGIVFSPDRKEILLVKRRDMPVWVLPGGQIEPNESPVNACIREVFEETGYNVVTKHKIGEYHYSGEDGFNTLFECEITGGKATLSSESKEVEFINIDRLPSLRPPFLDFMIKDALHYSGTEISRFFDGFPIEYWVKAITHPWALFKYCLVKMGIHWNT